MKMKKIDFEKLYDLWIRFIEKHSEKELFKWWLYPTQKKIFRAILYNSIYRNWREVDVCITRQYWKSTIVFKTLIFLSIFAPSILWYPINIWISVPQRNQAKQNMDKLRDNLRKILPSFKMCFEENNKTDVRLSNGSIFYVFSLEDWSNNESRTLHISIVDEAHKINDEKYNREIKPMLSNTWWNEVFIWVWWTRVCQFYESLNDTSQKKDIFIFNFLEALKEKQEYYEKTNDERHLFYKRSIEWTNESEWMRKDTDEFKTEYMLEWILWIWNYIARDELIKFRWIECNYLEVWSNVCYAWIDFWKKWDFSVLTIVTLIDWKIKVVRWEKIQWDYKIQLQKIKEICSKYSILYFYCDSTWVGDWVIDFFEPELWKNRMKRIVFTQKSKHDMYTNLTMVFQDWFEYIQNDIHTKTFEKEMTDLQKEYKWNYMSIHHPNWNWFHDDYPDSLALACLFKSWPKFLVGNVSV